MSGMTKKLIKFLFYIVAVLLITAWPVAFAQDAGNDMAGGMATQKEITPPSFVQADPTLNDIDYRDIIRYVDREVVKEATSEKPIEWREFTSLEELESWLAEDDTDRYVYLLAGEDGVPRNSAEYDCDDYAIALQRRAAESGFLMSVTIIEEQGVPHMINLVCIGNDIYYIEPQTDEVWFYCHRD